MSTGRFWTTDPRRWIWLKLYYWGDRDWFFGLHLRCTEAGQFGVSVIIGPYEAGVTVGNRK